MTTIITDDNPEPSETSDEIKEEIKEEIKDEIAEVVEVLTEIKAEESEEHQWQNSVNQALANQAQMISTMAESMDKMLVSMELTGIQMAALMEMQQSLSNSATEATEIQEPPVPSLETSPEKSGEENLESETAAEVIAENAGKAARVWL